MSRHDYGHEMYTVITDGYRSAVRAGLPPEIRMTAVAAYIHGHLHAVRGDVTPDEALQILNSLYVALDEIATAEWRSRS